VLTQYRPTSLNQHIGTGRPWDLDRMRGGVQLLQPSLGNVESDWYRGTADALFQNLVHLRRRKPDECWCCRAITCTAWTITPCTRSTAPATPR